MENLLYVLLQELQNELRLRILGKWKILGKPQICVETWPSAQSPLKILDFGSSS